MAVFDTANRYYFQARAQAARDLAGKAADPNARDAHIRMAEQYDFITRCGLRVAFSPLDSSVRLAVESSIRALTASQSLLRQTDVLVASHRYATGVRTPPSALADDPGVTSEGVRSAPSRPVAHAPSRR